MITRRTLEGALKCSLRDLRRELWRLELILVILPVLWTSGGGWSVSSLSPGRLEKFERSLQSCFSICVQRECGPLSDSPWRGAERGSGSGAARSELKVDDRKFTCDDQASEVYIDVGRGIDELISVSEKVTRLGLAIE